MAGLDDAELLEANLLLEREIAAAEARIAKLERRVHTVEVEAESALRPEQFRVRKPTQGARRHRPDRCRSNPDLRDLRVLIDQIDRPEGPLGTILTFFIGSVVAGFIWRCLFLVFHR